MSWLTNQKIYAFVIYTAMLWSCSKKSDEVPDTEAPKINLKQSSIWLEVGDKLAPNTLVISISDNTDPNPTITASLNGQPISYTDVYAFATAGDFTLKIKATDKSGNANASDIAINVGTGMPTITGLDNLQTTLNPKIGIPMDLLSGIKASDTKDGDLTTKIKVYNKDTNGQYVLITNPNTYTVEIPGILNLKYQITDNSNQTTEVEKTLNIIQEVISIPQMQIIPTDPAFNPNDPGWWNGNSIKNWTDYLNTLKIPEVRAMGEAMVRSGTNDMSKSEYLSKLNKWQLALNNANGIPMGTDAEGQYVIPNTAFPQTAHEDMCNHLLLGKKNNGKVTTWLAGPLIQQGGVNKAVWMEDWWTTPNSYHYPTPVKNWLQNNPDKYLIISTSANIGGTKDQIKELLQTGRLIWFQWWGNLMQRNGNMQSISATEESYTGDDTKEFKFWAWSYSYWNDVPIHIQRVWWSRENFQVTTGIWGATDPYSAFMTWAKEDIRYTPAVHAYLNGNNILQSNFLVPSSVATPVQTGLFYLLVACYPEKTPAEIIELARTTYSYPVKVDYAPNPSMGYTSKTIDVGKAYKDLNSKIPAQISLSSSSPIQIQKGRYKFNIIHGEGVVLSNGSKVTQADVDNITKRWLLAQESYSISPEALKKLWKKSWDKITIHVSVCGDDQEQYKQIRDIPYEVLLIN